MRASSVSLWFSILSGPISVGIDLELRYALVQWACWNHRAWTLSAISIPFLVLALIGAATGWSYSRTAHGRMHFMALGGLTLSLISALTIIALTIPDFFLHPCD
jgi:hypothetical protein